MAVMAQWLNKKWEVSSRKIVALEGLSTSYKLQANTNSDAEGKPPINVRQLDLQPIKFDTFLCDAVGVNVRSEIESWSALIGESAPFILGGKRFGPEMLMLTDVSVSDIEIDDFGRMRQAKLGLSFMEDAPEDAKSKPQNEYVAGSSAAGVGASTADKAAKKPTSI